MLVGKINEPKLKNFQFMDLYVIIACPEMTVVEYKKFNTHVVTPHECLMALQPEIFPWECKVLTDYNMLLSRLIEADTSNKAQDCTDILEHEFQADETALVAISNSDHRALVPIFSS